MSESIPLASGPNDLRSALRRLAKAVVILSCRWQGRRYAMAATAVSEVSVNPPTMLVCVATAASIHPALAARAPFCINLLHADHRALSERCSGAEKGEARFAEGAWYDDGDATPYLGGAQANIFCTTHDIIARHTHSIFLADVTRCEVAGTVAPLVYCDGAYGRWSVA